MADDKKKSGNRNIHTSYVGTFKADSFEVDDKGVATAVLETPGGEKIVKGYNDNAKTLEEAVKAGGEQIIRGTLLGGSKNPHMGIYATGPEQIAGVVSNVRDNFDTYEKDGKQPFINAFVMVERGEARIGRPMTAYGDDALSLKGLKDGDRLEIPARTTHEQRGKEGDKKWTELFRATGAGKFEPAAEKSKEADESPAP